MTPAFRSTRSIVAFSVLIVLLICLPFLLLLVGAPSRQQVWSAMPTRAGDVGDVVRALYYDKAPGDVVLVGSSLVRRGVDVNALQNSLSRRFHRPVAVESLALNWPGADVQYAMLKDYLEHHQPKIILWNAPAVATPWNEAHSQAYRWYRLGDYPDVVRGLPIAGRIQLYAEAIFGAPKQILLKLRPTLLGATELGDREGEDAHRGLMTGYEGSRFVAEAGPTGSVPTVSVIDAGRPPVTISGRRLSAYQMHFAQAIVALTRSHHCRLYLLHVPTDEEYRSSSIPEVVNWSSATNVHLQEVAVPAATLFAGMDRGRFLHFFSDHHLNANGRELFTRSLLPEVSRLLDQSGATGAAPSA